MSRAAVDACVLHASKVASRSKVREITGRALASTCRGLTFVTMEARFVTKHMSCKAFSTRHSKPAAAAPKPVAAPKKSYTIQACDIAICEAVCACGVIPPVPVGGVEAVPQVWAQERPVQGP